MEAKQKRSNGRKALGGLLKGIGFVVVGLWLGSASLDFFAFITPPEKWWFAYLGFGLTGGGMILYIYLFRYDAITSIQKITALIMFLVSLFGELATAGFGFQVEAWKNGGYVMTNSDFEFMTLVIQILGLAHALALITYSFGDFLMTFLSEFFGDEDGDGVPDGIDSIDNRTGKAWSRPQKHPQQQPRQPAQLQPANAYQSATPLAPAPQVANQGTNYNLADLLAASGETAGAIRARYMEYGEFAAWCSGQFDHISGGNMRRIWNELNPTSRQRQQ